MAVQCAVQHRQEAGNASYFRCPAIVAMPYCTPAQTQKSELCSTEWRHGMSVMV